MHRFVSLIKAAFPVMSEATLYQVMLLQHQYRSILLGEHLEDFDSRAFQRLLGGAECQKISQDVLPLEVKVACFLANPEWAGRESLEKTIKEALDRTMVADELEEMRRIRLQNLELDSASSLADVRLRILADPQWAWALNPRWFDSAYGDDRVELLKLKHRYFHEIGWLSDPTEDNPVIHFQLTYLRNPRIPLDELLQLDMKIPRGSEIFHRIRDANPFLLSYIYSRFKRGGRAALSEWTMEAS